MTAIALKQETDNYWGLIKDAGNEVKLALIQRLTEALTPVVATKGQKGKKRKYTADDFAGIWSDAQFKDAKEINNVIRDARHTRSSRDKFWSKL